MLSSRFSSKHKQILSVLSAFSSKYYFATKTNWKSGQTFFERLFQEPSVILAFDPRKFSSYWAPPLQWPEIVPWRKYLTPPQWWSVSDETWISSSSLKIFRGNNNQSLGRVLNGVCFVGGILYESRSWKDGKSEKILRRKEFFSDMIFPCVKVFQFWTIFIRLSSSKLRLDECSLFSLMNASCLAN